MANRTDSQAKTIKGQNPQFLISRIVRTKIYDDPYWKEFCFALSAISLVDMAVKLPYIGGTYGGRRRPTKFICLLLKMLQLEPGIDVATEYMQQEDNKYLRALGAAYIRMTADSKESYTLLEPLYNDLRKLRVRKIDGTFEIKHMDEFIDMLLQDSLLFDDISFPTILNRQTLEETEDFPPYISAVADDFDFNDVDLEPPSLPPPAPSKEPIAQPKDRAPDVAEPPKNSGVAATTEPRRRSRSRERNERHERRRSRSRERRERRRSPRADRGDRARSKDREKEPRYRKDRDKEHSDRTACKPRDHERGTTRNRSRSGARS